MATTHRTSAPSTAPPQAAASSTAASSAAEPSPAAPSTAAPSASRDPLGLRARARRSGLLLTVLGGLVALSLLLCVGIGPVPLSPTMKMLAALGAAASIIE